MSQAPQVTPIEKDELPADMLELVTVVAALPPEHRTRLEPLVTGMISSTRRRRRILSLVQDALSQLRLDMKYLMFDLEATRRERDEYRTRLEEEEA